MKRPTPLGDGSAYAFEPDGSLTLYLDHRNTEAQSKPLWRVSHAFTPEETKALARALRENVP